jgi:CRISPR system Cascade subunit CasE
LEHAAEQFGVTDSDKLWETKDYENLLGRIEDDTVWHFRLTANPTNCCRTKQGERGIVRAHITPFYQKKWLMERGEKSGFSVEEEEFFVTESYWKRFYKGSQRKKPVTFLSVTYEGILKVTDAEKFRKTLTDGLGRGKAFGMGMLTVVKAGAVNNE